jgi:sugar (pentulose or hexulose) kinase
MKPRMADLLGFDVGTSSSKGVLANHSGHIIATAKRAHQVSRRSLAGWRWTPRSGGRSSAM